MYATNDGEHIADNRQVLAILHGAKNADGSTAGEILIDLQK
jgi:hypothetical protein